MLFLGITKFYCDNERHFDALNILPKDIIDKKMIPKDQGFRDVILFNPTQGSAI